MENRDNRYRSFFWPVLLIGIGVIWLLDNFGILPDGSINLLLNLWPVILIVIGIDLLLGRRSGILGGLIGLLLVGALLAVLLAGPSLGLNLPQSDLKVETFTVPLEQAKTATIRINSSSEPVEVTPVSGDLLFDATIGHIGELDFNASGTTDKNISLSKSVSVGFQFAGLGNRDQLKWEIGLTDKIPLSLDIDSGSGAVAMDLTGIQLSNLRIDSGSGSYAVVLPGSQNSYTVELTSGSGAGAVTLPAGTPVTLRTDTGSGSLTIKLPAGAAARIEVLDSGSGSVRLPNNLTRIEGRGNDDEGVWETSGYASAQEKILIQLQDVGSGSINIR